MGGMGALLTRARLRALGGLLALAGGTSALLARPPPTPTVDLLHPPRRRAPPRTVPEKLEVNRAHFPPLGDFDVYRREDGVVRGGRMRALVRTPHDYLLGQGVLLYEAREEHEMRAVGVGELVEVHPLGRGRERLVFRVHCRYLQLGYGWMAPGARPSGPPRPFWQAGKDPAENRYFTHARNATGVHEWLYARLTSGKIWKHMPELLIRVAMGAPARVETKRTPFGLRERWWYPRSAEHSTWITVDGGQLRGWHDDWDRTLPGERPDPVGPLVGRGRD